MGSSFIITETMLQNNGRKLMTDFFDRIHDEDKLAFEETKHQRKFYDENVVRIYTQFVRKDLDLRSYKLHKFDLGNAEKRRLSDDELKEKIKKNIDNKTIELEFVYDFLSEMDKKINLDTCLEFEIHEDHFCLKKAFLKAYELFYHEGFNLKNE